LCNQLQVSLTDVIAAADAVPGTAAVQGAGTAGAGLIPIPEALQTTTSSRQLAAESTKPQDFQVKLTLYVRLIYIYPLDRFPLQS